MKGGIKEKEITSNEFKDSVHIEELIASEATETIITSTITQEEKKAVEYDTRYLEILGIWKREKKIELIMKISICVALGLLLVGQIVSINKIIFDIGYKEMVFDEWTIRIFITGVFCEIVALVKIMISNLFPQNGSKDFMEFLNKLYDKDDIDEVK